MGAERLTHLRTAVISLAALGAGFGADFGAAFAPHAPGPDRKGPTARQAASAAGGLSGFAKLLGDTVTSWINDYAPMLGA